MKARLLFYVQLFVIAYLSLSYCQNGDKYYYDDNWIGCPKDKATYYKILKIDAKGKIIGKVFDYYITGEQQSEKDSALFVDKNDDTHSKYIGKDIVYAKSGEKLSEYLYDKNANLKYIIGYNNNGNKSFEADIVNGNKLGNITKYDMNGKITEQKTNKENLGKKVNSEYNDHSPVISPDEKCIYFVRRGHISNIGYYKNKLDEDIWYSIRLNDSSWSEAINIGPPLNNINYNGVVSITPDGNTLFLNNKYYLDGTSDQGYSISHRILTGWSIPENLKIINYYNLSKYSSAFLTNDGKTLLLAAKRHDSYGVLDIYVSFFIEQNLWSEPINLGPTINTSGYEGNPFLASDGVSLYFSSNGHGGYGGSDIFVSRRIDDTWKNWSKPENLGPTINSIVHEGGYTIPASGKYAYFVSLDNYSGSNDIFRVPLPDSLKPKPVVLIGGKTINGKTKQPIEAKIIYEVLPDGKEIGIARSNPKDGNYKIALPAGKKYGFRAEANGFISVNDNIQTSNITKYTDIERNLELIPIEAGQVVRLNNIFFDFGKTFLREESFPELERAIRMMDENPNISIEITGHTDEKGTSDYNLQLSELRAKAVADYILQKIPNKTRVKYRGYGKTKPIADNDTEEGRQLNRRVEFIIIE